MKIKDLPNYEIDIKDGRLTVYSLSHRKTMKLRSYRNRTPGYALQAKKGEQMRTVWVSACTLRILMNRPDLSIWDLYGTGESRAAILEKRKRYGGDNDLPRFRGDTFRNIDDAMETLQLLKRAQEGEITPLVCFLHGARTGAVNTVSGFTGIPPARVDLYFEEAEQKFLEQVKTLRVQRIMPLYPWLCKCLKAVCKEKRATVPMDYIL
ncbi:MAG: hypothetical protein NC048_10335 [Bacteroides sp.]|nr:hypothetical protein [Bacteroides sp.]